MSENAFPAGAYNRSDAPYNQKSHGDCKLCDGTGEVTECCDNEGCMHCIDIQLDETIMYHTCKRCEGSGEKSLEDSLDEYESYLEDRHERC